MKTVINSPELNEILNLTPSNQNILLVGRHGIGKSEILTNYFEKKKLNVVPLFLGQMADPGDLIGLPYFNKETGHTEYYPPYWFPLDDKPVVLFLDELNRARPELMQSVMDLALNRKLAGKKLPEGSQVIAAVNDGEEYQVEELDPALISRFNVYYFEPEIMDWIKWAQLNNLDSRVVKFIKESQDQLDNCKKSSEDEEDSFCKTPDRRAWKKVSDVVKNIRDLKEKHIKLISGIVGREAAVSFIVSSKLNENDNMNIENFWNKGSDSFKALMILSSNEFCEFTDKVYSTLVPFSDDDIELLRHIQIFDSFVEWVSSGDRNEALGYIVSVFTDNKFPEANEFIKQKCEKAKEIMMKFIEENYSV